MTALEGLDVDDEHERVLFGAVEIVDVVREGVVEIAVAESCVACERLRGRTDADGPPLCRAGLLRARRLVRGIVDHLARPAPGLHHRVECLEVLAGLLELALLDALGENAMHPRALAPVAVELVQEPLDLVGVDVRRVEPEVVRVELRRHQSNRRRAIRAHGNPLAARHQREAAKFPLRRPERPRHQRVVARCVFEVLVTGGLLEALAPPAYVVQRGAHGRPRRRQALRCTTTGCPCGRRVPSRGAAGR